MPRKKSLFPEIHFMSLLLCFVLFCFFLWGGEALPLAVQSDINTLSMAATKAGFSSQDGLGTPTVQQGTRQKGFEAYIQDPSGWIDSTHRLMLSGTLVAYCNRLSHDFRALRTRRFVMKPGAFGYLFGGASGSHKHNYPDLQELHQANEIAT